MSFLRLFLNKNLDAVLFSISQSSIHIYEMGWIEAILKTVVTSSHFPFPYIYSTN